MYHKLTDEIREKRVKEAKQLLSMLESAHRSNHTNIITDDESWFRYTNETRTQLVQKREQVDTRVLE